MTLFWKIPRIQVLPKEKWDWVRGLWSSRFLALFIVLVPVLSNVRAVS